MEELEKTFDFNKRSSYDASKSLARIRSSKYKRVKPPMRYELWNKPAPDLRMQLYHPHPVPRNSREAIQPWKYKASFDHDEVGDTQSIFVIEMLYFMLLAAQV